jgi:glycosyltransferase involved in cell wall biosynthesis
MDGTSVVVPVYNGERFIGEALRSVFAQTLPASEVVVIDDGSTDRTKEIVSQFGESVHYYYQPNKGAAEARNRGIAAACGEWIAFLDADDIWYPEKLALQFDYLKRHPEVQFVYSDLAICDENGVVLEADALKTRWEAERPSRNLNLDLISLAFNEQPFPHPSTVLIKKEVLVRAGGFNPAFRRNYHEDFEAFAKAAHISPPHFMAQTLVKYRRPAKRPSAEENFLLLLHSLYALWRDDPKKREAVRRCLAAYYGKKGQGYLCSGHYRQAREYLALALVYNPSDRHALRRRLVSRLPLVRKFYAFWQVRVRGKVFALSAELF